MNEYELYLRILAPRLKCRNQQVLSENKQKVHQVANVISDGIDAYTIYRYDMDAEEGNFLPFFNNTHDGDRGDASIPSPKDLLKFCDYILLVCKNDKLFVILVEMKSGTDGDALKQLRATETFMEYVRLSAERIKFSNDFRNFSSKNIILKKVVLKPSVASKPGTNKAKSKSTAINWNDDVINLPSGTMPLLKFCK